MEVHEELKVHQGGLEVPKKDTKRSPRSLGFLRASWRSPRRVMVVPKDLKCGLEVPRGWREVPEVLRVPKVGMEMKGE